MFQDGTVKTFTLLSGHSSSFVWSPILKENSSSPVVSAIVPSLDESVIVTGMNVGIGKDPTGGSGKAFSLQMSSKSELNYIFNIFNPLTYFSVKVLEMWKKFKYLLLCEISSSWRDTNGPTVLDWPRPLTPPVVLRSNMDVTWLVAVLAAAIFVSLVVLTAVCLHCRNKGPLGGTMFVFILWLTAADLNVTSSRMFSHIWWLMRTLWFWFQLPTGDFFRLE